MGYIVIDENGYVYGTKIPFIKVPCTSFGFMNIREFQYKRMFNNDIKMISN